MNSTRNTARLAGLLYLLTAVTGGFGYFYVQSKVIVRWDAAATAANIIASEPLFRAAIVSNLVSQVLMFFFGLTLFRVLKEVDKAWATVFIASVLMSVTVAVVNAMNSFGALLMLSQAEWLKVFTPDQLKAMALIFLRLNGFGQGLLEIFWSPYYFAFGLIIIKHRILPVVLGFLLIMMGAGYWINILDKFLIPQFHPLAFTRLAMSLGALGGIPAMLWLLIKGADVQPLNEPAS